MVRPSITPLEEVIEWDFHVAEQHNQARYGTTFIGHYKQFLPGGVVISRLHPPKLIPKALYERAKKYAIE